MSIEALDFFLDEFDDEHLAFAYFAEAIEDENILPSERNDDSDEFLFVLTFKIVPTGFEIVHEVDVTGEQLRECIRDGSNLSLDLIRQIADECNDWEGRELLAWGKMVKEAYDRLIEGSDSI